MFAVVRTRANHIVQNGVWIQIESSADLHESLRTEGSLRVDIPTVKWNSRKRHGFSLAASLLDWQLANDTERVAHLRFSRSELSVELRDGSRFHSAFVSNQMTPTTRQNSIQFLTTCGDVNNVLSLFVIFSCLLIESVEHSIRFGNPWESISRRPAGSFARSPH